LSSSDADNLVGLDPNQAAIHETLPALSDIYEENGYRLQAAVAIFADDDLNCRYVHILGSDFRVGLVVGALDIARHNLLHKALVPDDDDDE